MSYPYLIFFKIAVSHTRTRTYARTRIRIHATYKSTPQTGTYYADSSITVRKVRYITIFAVQK